MGGRGQREPARGRPVLRPDFALARCRGQRYGGPPQAQRKRGRPPGIGGAPGRVTAREGARWPRSTRPLRELPEGGSATPPTSTSGRCDRALLAFDQILASSPAPKRKRMTSTLLDKDEKAQYAYVSNVRPVNRNTSASSPCLLNASAVTATSFVVSGKALSASDTSSVALNGTSG